MAMHDLNLVAIYADRVGFLVNGKLIAMGKSNEVLTQDNIAKAYNTPVNIINHPEYGTPFIVPSRDI